MAAKGARWPPVLRRVMVCVEVGRGGAERVGGVIQAESTHAGVGWWLEQTSQ